MACSSSAAFASRGLCRRDVGVNRLLPGAHARERMRWHVQRVGRGRRNRRIALCRTDGFVSQRRDVVAMNDVVGDAGMIRLTRVQLLEDRARLELIDVGLVAGQRRRGQRQRPENRGLAVLG